MNIYVGNIARNVTEEQLKQLFAQFGQVGTIKMVKDRFTGEPRGFAFVDMNSADEGKAAIAGLNGKEVEGQRLRVNEAQPREERGGGDFRGGPRRPYGSSNGGGYNGNNGGGFGRGPRY